MKLPKPANTAAVGGVLFCAYGWGLSDQEFLRGVGAIGVGLVLLLCSQIMKNVL